MAKEGLFYRFLLWRDKHIKEKHFILVISFPGRDMYGSVCDYPETVDTPDSAFAYRKF